MATDAGHLAASSGAAPSKPHTSSPSIQHAFPQSAPQQPSQDHNTEPARPLTQILTSPSTMDCVSGAAGALPELDRRLKTITEMIPPDSIVADIGTDHGYLMAYLAKYGGIRGGFACDVNPKPLEKAAATLSSVGVAHLVRTCLCDGLSGLQGEPLTHVVIAGMGGDLIWRILEDAPERRRETFLLQPMTKAHYLRRYLGENGFTLRRETAVASGRFVYTVMEAIYTGVYRQLTIAEAYFGELLTDRSPEAVLYQSKVREAVTKKIQGMERSSRSEALRTEIESYRRLLESIKERIT